MRGASIDDWDAALGPFYRPESVARLLGDLPVDALQEFVERGELIAVIAGEETLFPTFQFSDDGATLPALPPVLEMLRNVLSDPWDVALWLNSPMDDRGGETAATLLRAGHAGEVKRMAEEDVDRWSH
ncbi:hypothetical protein QWJ90_00135 [Microbacterium oryzae]|uniref:hypothetical protein n=1 Tax=Microbacterium oryzae TaxID=743009 RepID=UPI0025AFF85C|nr:hypothetical protein [Microbacterium oryzae]MDN3309335.1 hypothetical protein [Microbacterium oryzae]